MILAVLASDQQKREIASSSFFKEHETIFSENHSLWPNHAADAFIDLSEEPSEERTTELSRLFPKPVLIHSVVHTLDQIHPDFIRINGWPGFLKGNLLEAAAKGESMERARQLFGENLVFVKDEPGFISARIVAMIINEAYFTWESDISTKEEIDLAMKLGTGYPYGPFEWAEMIGVKNVVSLLKKLSETNPIYEISESLLANK